MQKNFHTHTHTRLCDIIILLILLKYLFICCICWTCWTCYIIFLASYIVSTCCFCMLLWTFNSFCICSINKRINNIYTENCSRNCLTYDAHYNTTHVNRFGKRLIISELFIDIDKGISGRAILSIELRTRRFFFAPPHPRFFSRHNPFAILANVSPINV